MKLLGVVLLALFTLYNAGKSYKSKYNLVHALPIRVNDKAVTQLVDEAYITSIWKEIGQGVLMLVCGGILEWGLLKETKEERSKRGRVTLKIMFEIICLLVIPVSVAKIAVDSGKAAISKLQVEDWSASPEDWIISVRTVERLEEKGGRGRRYYVRLAGDKENYSISWEQYAVFLDENDPVYYIQDKVRGTTLIWSLKQYQYVGDRLDVTMRPNVEVATNTRFYWFQIVICVIVFIVELCYLWNLIKKMRRMDENR